MASKCTSIQKSLGWCQGTPELPGVKRRIYYLAKSEIVVFPQLPRDTLGRATSAVLDGSYTLAADAKWKYIDILPDKSQLTSEAQGELPSQTQLNKLTAVHPGVGAEASAAAAYINNSDNVFIVEDMKGNYRVLGNDKWNTKANMLVGYDQMGDVENVMVKEYAPFILSYIATMFFGVQFETLDKRRFKTVEITL